MVYRLKLPSVEVRLVPCGGQIMKLGFIDEFRLDKHRGGTNYPAPKKD